MSPDPGQEQTALSPADNGGRYRVDARGAEGLLIGDESTQINYFYNRTWTDGIVPPPLVSVSGTIASPYRGLSAFEERDAALFFGREAAAGEVLALMSHRLEGAGLCVVSGVSGAGKSSLLRAGVLPRLRGAGLRSASEAASWPCLVFTPTSRPLEELAVRVAPLAKADAAALREGLAADPARFALIARQAALADAGGGRQRDAAVGAGQRLVLIVDQVEQLFTRCQDEDERQAFISALHAAATTRPDAGELPGAVVVLVVRADFEARLADYPQLALAVQDRYLLTSMTQRQLRMAITQPAVTAGASVDADLVDVLLAEMQARLSDCSAGNLARSPAGGAGALPLLSHALDQAWRHRTGQVLTLADYERTGGIEGAVAASAQRAYDRLTPAQQTAARQVFIRLTATSSDGADTAARTDRADLTAGKTDAQARDVEAVLETFAAERLLTLAASTVEISHEALLTAWPLLRDTWLADTHADRLVRARLHTIAQEWVGASRDPSYLYSGSLLETAATAAARLDANIGHAPLGRAETEFLRVSQRADRRRGRRRQGLTAVLLVLVVGLAAVTVAAVRASQASTRQRDIAIADQLTSESQAVGDTNATASQLESIAAWDIRPSAQTRYYMLAAAARPEIATLTAIACGVNSVALSPDGKIMATGSFAGTAQLWNLATHQQLGHQLGSALTCGKGNAYESVAFSPDGKTVATADQNAVQIWDVATGQQIGRFLAGSANLVNSLEFSPDGTKLAVLYQQGVRVWNVATHRQMTLPFAPRLADSLAFSPHGSTIATVSSDGVVRLWNMTTGRQIGKSFANPDGSVDSLAFSPDGKTVATASEDTVRLWDVATQRQIGRPFTFNVIGYGAPIYSLVFSPDGTFLAAADGVQPTPVVWDVVTRQQFGSALTGSNSSVTSLAFGPHDAFLAAGSSDGTVRLWNIAQVTGRTIGSLQSRGDLPDDSISLALSTDGKILAIGGDHSVRLWSATTGRQIGRTISAGSVGYGILSVAFSPDGEILATSTDRQVRLWDVATQQQIGHTLTAGSFNYGFLAVAFSPDGKILATSTDGQVRLWDVATQQQIGRLGAVGPIAFSPDGKILATSGDGQVRLWDVATQRRIGRLFAASSLGGPLAFSPDGKMLAVGSDGTVRLWDLATRRQIGTPIAVGPQVVDSVSFSPDGKVLATGASYLPSYLADSEDGTARMWDVATGQQIGTPLSGGLAVFDPAGSTLVTNGGDTAAHLWSVAYLHDTLTRLCSRVGGAFTTADWARYVPPGPAYRNTCP